MAICIDCGCKTESRRKGTLRCGFCNVIWKKSKAKGRTTGLCIKCGAKLSTKTNATGMCKICELQHRVVWNKGLKGLSPWNKGKSKFNNKEEFRIHRNKQRKTVRKKNRKQVIADRIRTLIRNSMKRSGTRKNGTKTVELLGCDVIFFIQYLESRFSENMNWSNYGNGHGKWNIDHIIPTSSFDLTSIYEQKRAFHYSNCRPMWAIENVKKGAKMPETRKLKQIVLPMLSAAIMPTMLPVKNMTTHGTN